MDGASPGDRSRLRPILFGLYVTVCLLMICWPGYALIGNRVEPYVFGLPLSLAWVVGWVVATFLVLVAFHLTAERRGGDGS